MGKLYSTRRNYVSEKLIGGLTALFALSRDQPCSIYFSIPRISRVLDRMRNPLKKEITAIEENILDSFHLSMRNLQRSIFLQVRIFNIYIYSYNSLFSIQNHRHFNLSSLFTQNGNDAVHVHRIFVVNTHVYRQNGEGILDAAAYKQMLILSFPHVISSLSSALKSSLLHSPPADFTVVATLLSAATSVNSVKRFRRFVRHVVRHSPPLDVNSRWSSPSLLVAVVAIVSRRRLIRLINETMPGLQIARARSSRYQKRTILLLFSHFTVLVFSKV